MPVEDYQPGDEIVPGFRLIHPIGRGAYGAVWAAEAPGGVACAIKVMSNLNANQMALELRALNLLRSLEHENLLPVHAFWQLTRREDNQDRPVLVVLSPLAAGNLTERLREHQRAGQPGIPLPELLRYMEQAARAIDYLNTPQHLLGDRVLSIQHRDIKPENILLTRQGHVKISDLGLAELLEGTTLTIPEERWGMTLAYAAPESFRMTVTRWTDQYSLAITWCWLRTGRFPFDHRSGSQEVIQAHLEGRLDLALVAAEEQAVLRRATHLDPERRFFSCVELVRALASATQTPPSYPLLGIGTESAERPRWAVGTGRPGEGGLDELVRTPTQISDSDGSITSTGMVAASPPLPPPPPRPPEIVKGRPPSVPEQSDVAFLDEPASPFHAQEEPAGPQTIQRQTDVSFPNRVPVGQITHLRLRIVDDNAPRRHAHDVPVVLELPPGKGPIPVAVCVAAENFTIQGEPCAILAVPRSGDSPAVNFCLIGQEVGPGRVMIDFSQDGRPVGSVDLSPEVVAGSVMDTLPLPTPTEVRLQPSGGEEPDVTVTVHEYRHCPGRLHFTLFSRHPRLKDLPFVNHGDLGTIDLHEGVVTWVQRQLEALGEAVASGQDDRALADIGNRLFEQVLPEPLQRLCWTFTERGVHSLLVLSDEPHIPWELVKPFRIEADSGRVDGRGFWGEDFALARWLRGPALTGQFTGGRICALAPSERESSSEGPVHRNLVKTTPVPPMLPGAALADLSPTLPAAQEELDLLRGLERSGALVRVLPARRREVLDAFERGEFDLLHIASHGAFGGTETADDSCLLLEDGLFRIVDLPPRLAATLRRVAPLVFFNGCHTGRLGYSLSRLGSWGAELIRLGCGGFVGTLWSVSDEAALELARAFYRLLFDGQPVAEALRQARLRVRQRYPGDPTWLAYSCFADPNARLKTARKTPARNRGLGRILRGLLGWCRRWLPWRQSN
jgi:serine/threonine protein kinase